MSGMTSHSLYNHSTGCWRSYQSFCMCMDSPQDCPPQIQARGAQTQKHTWVVVGVFHGWGWFSGCSKGVSVLEGTVGGLPSTDMVLDYPINKTYCRAHIYYVCVRRQPGKQEIPVLPSAIPLPVQNSISLSSANDIIILVVTNAHLAECVMLCFFCKSPCERLGIWPKILKVLLKAFESP
ncbi:hypothetical protein B0H10DRAFT_1955921 [Mycena sp. CBHHK59/15]|nr:hypothetical protein B0H10DRAFT_1955921 [Mycena sp. CBHHK59/15]